MQLLPLPIKFRIEVFQKERLRLLSQIQFSDLFRKRSFLSGEMVGAGDFVYHRLDEYFDEIMFPLYQELIRDLQDGVKPKDLQYDIVAKIGYYLDDPVYEDQWIKIYNRFVKQFFKNYVIDGSINWRKLDNIQIN